MDSFQVKILCLTLTKSSPYSIPEISFQNFVGFQDCHIFVFESELVEDGEVSIPLYRYKIRDEEMLAESAHQTNALAVKLLNIWRQPKRKCQLYLMMHPKPYFSPCSILYILLSSMSYLRYFFFSDMKPCRSKHIYLVTVGVENILPFQCQSLWNVVRIPTYEYIVTNYTNTVNVEVPYHCHSQLSISTIRSQHSSQAVQRQYLDELYETLLHEDCPQRWKYTIDDSESYKNIFYTGVNNSYNTQQLNGQLGLLYNVVSVHNKPTSCRQIQYRLSKTPKFIRDTQY